jgi:hypothetical protein
MLTRSKRNGIQMERFFYGERSKRNGIKMERFFYESEELILSMYQLSLN